MIGFKCPYHRCDETNMCLQAGQLALELGMDAWIYPTEKPATVSSMWDRRVANPDKTSFEDWLDNGIDQLYYVYPPSKEELKAVRGRTKAKINLLLLWEHVHKSSFGLLESFDRVISPSRIVSKAFTQRHGLSNLYTIPWDSGVPITFEPRDIDPRRLGVIWSLEDSELSRQEPKALQAINTLLESCPEVWLTVTYSKSLPAGTVREFRKLAQFADGRVELMHNLAPLKQELLFGRHDLTMWPTTCDSAGLLGLTSLAMGTPVIAFDHPLVGELIRDGRNGQLVACDLDEDEDGVPHVKPDYPTFGRQLVELLRNLDKLAALRKASVVGLRERRDEFRLRWKRFLTE